MKVEEDEWEKYSKHTISDSARVKFSTNENKNKPGSCLIYVDLMKNGALYEERYVLLPFLFYVDVFEVEKVVYQNHLPRISFERLENLENE